MAPSSFVPSVNEGTETFKGMQLLFPYQLTLVSSYLLKLNSAHHTSVPTSDNFYRLLITFAKSLDPDEA